MAPQEVRPQDDDPPSFNPYDAIKFQLLQGVGHPTIYLVKRLNIHLASEGALVHQLIEAGNDKRLLRLDAAVATDGAQAISSQGTPLMNCWGPVP